MQEHAWALAAARAFAAIVEPRVIVVGPLDRPRAVAPLAQPRGRTPRLETLGRPLWEPVDLLYRDESSLAELVRVLTRLRRPLFLSRLPHEAPTYALVRTAFRDAFVREHHRAGSPFLRLDDDWLEPEARIDSGRRSDLRRARRRAESHGDVAFEIHSPSADEVAALVDEAVAVEDRSWKGANGTSLARMPLLLDFYRRYARAAAAAGTLRVAFLRIADRAAAMQLAAVRDGAFWLLKMGYDEDYARASPGQLLVLETIRYAAERGLERYEFLGRAEPWTRVWTSDAHTSASLPIYPRVPASLAAALDDGVRLVAAAARTRMRR
jgi:CelD/BcsL family acetyltransferase involved in cellulose biosynthesis